MSNEQIPPGGKAPTTDVIGVLGEIQAGVLITQLGHALTQLSASTIEFGKTGEVVLKFKTKQISDACQLVLDSTMSYKIPTSRGERAEKTTFKTPLFVGRGGALSITPETMDLTLVGGGHPHVRA